jgi:hypothetical protein
MPCATCELRRERLVIDRLGDALKRDTAERGQKCRACVMIGLLAQCYLEAGCVAKFGMVALRISELP